ncbi:hypothetical protein MMC07_004818 [Pseudocyphellaria aurata]|nr:hypothetical protein [Pseudocyphellaria aurata]
MPDHDSDYSDTGLQPRTRRLRQRPRVVVDPDSGVPRVEDVEDDTAVDEAPVASAATPVRRERAPTGVTPVTPTPQRKHAPAGVRPAGDVSSKRKHAPSGVRPAVDERSPRKRGTAEVSPTYSEEVHSSAVDRVNLQDAADDAVHTLIRGHQQSMNNTNKAITAIAAAMPPEFWPTARRLERLFHDARHNRKDKRICRAADEAAEDFTFEFEGSRRLEARRLREKSDAEKAAVQIVEGLRPYLRTAAQYHAYQAGDDMRMADPAFGVGSLRQRRHRPAEFDEEVEHSDDSTGVRHKTRPRRRAQVEPHETDPGSAEAQSRFWGHHGEKLDVCIIDTTLWKVLHLHPAGLLAIVLAEYIRSAIIE